MRHYMYGALALPESLSTQCQAHTRNDRETGFIVQRRNTFSTAIRTRNVRTEALFAVGLAEALLLPAAMAGAL